MLLDKIVYKWSDIDIYAMKQVLANYGFLVYMYYTHPDYQTSSFGKNHAYYIRIFTVSKIKVNKQNVLSFAYPALEFSQNTNFSAVSLH